MARRTLALVDSETSRLPDNTCETVVTLTPARSATWAIVARGTEPGLRPSESLVIIDPRKTIWLCDVYPFQPELAIVCSAA